MSGRAHRLPDMLRVLIWIIGLFALAVGLTVAARYSPGLVLLVLPQHRIELSVTFALLLLGLAFLLLYAVTRALVLALAMPGRAREYRAEQERARARRAMEDAIRAWLEGRYGKTQRAAEEAAVFEQWRMPSLALAARAAHELRNYPARDLYLKRMDEAGDEDAYLREITRADLLLEERRYLDALHALDRLPDRHTGALKLELKAHQLARNWEQVLALLPQLERRKVMETSVLAQTRRLALSENLKRKAIHARDFREYWDRLPASDQRDPLVASAAAQCFVDLGDAERAHAIIEDSLAQEWNPQLLELYVEGLPRDARRYLERAEQWLELHADDPALLLALGELCMHQGLWGKARSYLEASMALEPSHVACVRLGALLERTGQPDEAARIYRRGLELTLEQLERAKAQRRRPFP